jgi:hypothetical protein
MQGLIIIIVVWYGFLIYRIYKVLNNQGTTICLNKPLTN